MNPLYLSRRPAHARSGRWSLVLTLVVVFCTVSFFASNLWAQNKTVQLNAGQQMLINEGARASNEGDYDRALRLLRTSLDLGSVNVGYLNYGRALQKAGRCDEAREAFDKALLAPPVDVPSVDKVRNVIDQYRLELAKTCPGQVVVTCKSDEAMVHIAPLSAFRCDGTPRSLKPGVYKVETTQGTVKKMFTVQIRAFSTVHLSVPSMQPIAMDARKYQIRGESFERDGKLSAATNAFLKAYSVAPHWGPPMLRLGSLFYRRKDYVNTIKWLERYRAYAAPDEVSGLDKMVSSAENLLRSKLESSRSMDQADTKTKTASDLKNTASASRK